MTVCIARARLLGHKGLQQLWIDHQGKLRTIQSMDISHPDTAMRVIDVSGDWISLGGIDLQINGALGLAFPDLSWDHQGTLQKICQLLWDQGIDGFLPTLVTAPVEKIQQALAVLEKFVATAPQLTAQVLGAHLEGPFLNPEKRGAHAAKYLLPLNVEQVEQVLGDFGSLVKVITLAPELDLTGETISYLRSRGILVSLGHSLATVAQAQAAFMQGASMVTHAFNAMPGLHHREPGLLGAAIVHPAVSCGLIADGQHVSPIMIDILLRTCAKSWVTQPLAQSLEKDAGIFLVSDALAPLGLPDGIYPWDFRSMEVKQGTARLPDGTLCGTTLPLLVGVQNLVRWNICSVETAIALATETPRKVLGLAGLSVGQPAHQLLRWHQDSATGKLTWHRLFDPV